MLVDIPFDFIDIGFNTQARKWMLEFYDNSGMQNSMHMVRSVEIYNGTGSQFAFKNPMMSGPRPIWHVRERYYKTEVLSIEIINDAAIIKSISHFKSFEIPQNYRFIRYNYSINNNITKVFFLDENHIQIGEPCIRRYILTDNLDHKTFGDYPNIFLECSKQDLKDIIITDSYIILVGNASKTGMISQPVDNADIVQTHSTLKVNDAKFHIDTKKKK